MKKLFDKNEVVAVCLDMQSSMINSIHKGDFMKDRAIRFFKSMRVLNVPILVTQQYTRGLGDTDADIKEAIGEFEYIDKTSFSCMGEPTFIEALEKTGRKKVVIAGMEAHICVLQTAMDLIDAGYEVYVLVDACSSRNKLDKKIGLERMRAEGIKIATYESVVFEMLQKAGSDEFKQISKIVK